jgi:acyl-CoA thioesterase-2
MDDWVLFELDSPVCRGGRGLGRGLLFTRDGELVASSVQEGLLRST